MKIRYIPLVVVALSLPAQPVLAENDMMEGLAGQLLRGLIDRITEDIGPLSEAIPEIPGYHLPEVLPNGDIIIRRKRELPPPGPGEIDL